MLSKVVSTILMFYYTLFLMSRSCAVMLLKLRLASLADS